MESAKLDEAQFLVLPIGKVMEVFASRSVAELTNSAMIGVSVALGNHSQRLSADPTYFNHVASFVTDVIAVYVERAAALQLGLLSFDGVNSTKATLAAFLPQLEKVKTLLMGDEEVAETVIREPNRAQNFLLAILAMTAVQCQNAKEVAGLFGLKKKLFGGLKYKH